MNETGSFSRNCPKCNSVITYTHPLAWEISERLHTVCGDCAKRLGKTKVAKVVPIAISEITPVNQKWIIRRRWKHWAYHIAKGFMAKAGLKTRNEFQQWCKEGKRPDYIPYNPQKTYKGDWRGWKSFLSVPALKEEMAFKKSCPSCGKELTYAHKNTLTESIKRNRVCGICKWKKRHCGTPTPNKETV